MNWYQPLDKRILEWRRWRLQLPEDIPAAMLGIQEFWNTAPIKKVTNLTDDQAMWPSPWALFDTQSYCGHLRALGMFYTLCLVPRFRQLNPEIWILYNTVGERMVIAVADQGQYVLNFHPIHVVNIQSVTAEPQQIIKFYPEDFKKLE